MTTITICAVDREPSYLNQTTTWISENSILKPRVVMQGVMWNGRITTIKPFDDVQHNARYNYAHALIASEGLVLEDDVQICRYFDKHLLEVQNLVKERGLDRYIVALYSCYSWGKTDLKVVDYPVERFYGTQAMLMDGQTAKELGRWILKRLHIESEPHDFAIKSYCKATGTPLLASSYSLVQHLGKVTTGLGKFHRCHNFIDDCRYV